MNKNDSHDLLKMIEKGFRLPPIKIFDIDNVHNKDKILKYFLSCIAPSQTEEFIFSCRFSASVKDSISSFYLPVLLEVCNNTLSCVKFIYWCFSCVGLCSIVKSCSKAETLSLKYCNLELSYDYDFSGYEFKTKYLFLNRIYFEKVGEMNRDSFEMIINAISYSPLRYSLISITAISPKLSESRAVKIMKKYSLDHIAFKNKL